MTDLNFDSIEHLYASLRMLPEQERFAALGVIDRLRKEKIDHIQAAQEIKSLFIRTGHAKEETVHE